MERISTFSGEIVGVTVGSRESVGSGVIVGVGVRIGSGAFVGSGVIVGVGVVVGSTGFCLSPDHIVISVKVHISVHQYEVTALPTPNDN